MWHRLTSALRAPGRERGQSTTEYVLVIVVAASAALLLLNWARGGALTQFFQAMFDKVTTMFA